MAEPFVKQTYLASEIHRGHVASYPRQPTDYYVSADATSTFRIVEAIKQLGPRNSCSISRITGIPDNTIRYKIHKQLVRKGITVQASIDYWKMGLTTNWVSMEFSNEYWKTAPSILEALSKNAYLTFFARLLPQNIFATVIRTPREGFGRYLSFLERLVEVGVLNSYRVDPLLWIRHLSMNPRYYDFDKGAWKVDWEEVEKSAVEIQRREINGGGAFYVDKIDILLLKEMQIDCLRSLTEIGRKLHIRPKTLRYHFREHIEKRGLISRYVVRWFGSPSLEARKSIPYLTAEIREPSSEMLWQAQNVFHRLPFTWLDAISASQDFYMAQVVLPVSSYTETVEYLARNGEGFAKNLKLSLIDQTCTCNYTLPHEMFNEDYGWAFEGDRALDNILQASGAPPVTRVPPTRSF